MTTLPATVRERIDLPAPPSASAPSGEDAGMTVQDVLGVLKRRSLLIIFLFILFSALLVGAWVYSYVWWPFWRAEAFIECISDKPKRAETLAEDAPGQQEYERFIMTQAEFVKGPDVLMEALKTPEVRGTKWYRDTPEEDRILDFFNLVQAAPQRNTQLLSVSVKTHDRGDPDVIVNKVVDLYLNRVKEYNTGEYRRERESYLETLDTVEKQIIDKQTQLAQVQRKLPAGVVSGAGNTLGVEAEQKRMVVTQYELMQRELEGLKALYDLPGGAGLTPEDTQLVELDPKVATLSNQLFTVLQQIAVFKDTLGANHRSTKRLEKTRDVVEKQLLDERQRRMAEILAYKRESVRSAYLNIEHALMLSQQDYADTTAHLADMDSVMGEYVLLEEELFLLKQQREAAKDYIRELDRVVKERAAVRIELRQPAIEPLQRAFPQIFLLPGCIVIALAMSVGIALLLELVDTSLRTPQDVVRHLRIALLGVVPDADDEEVPIETLETAVLDAPHSMFAECFRTIRTNLQFAGPAEQQRSILITSPRPEDGKTTIACNLAVSVAQSGRRVLLVDANLRRPAYHRIFDLPVKRGLSNLLIGDAKVEEVVAKSRVPNLDVLVSGPLPPNPAELLGSEQMGEFIAHVTTVYDQVIIGTTPVLVASDACSLATRVDGVILVCRAKANSRGIGGRACGLISRVGGHILGGVLNAAQVRRGGYFREQLRTFYDYRPDEDHAPATAALPTRPGSTTGDDAKA
jgi:polysaccharide biosynthesis transport protein